MSSSSDSEDENLKQFAAAVDTSLFNNEFYKPKEENDKKIEEPKIELKSQRYLENTENVFQSELNVSENMKQFIGKKMSKLIEESIEYVDIKNQIKEDPEVNCVRLLRGTKECVNIDEAAYDNIQQHKVPIKRRKVDEDDVKESTKVQQASTDIDKINQEISNWDEKNRHKLIRFKKGKDGKCHMIEEPNEFSKSRSRNGWTESKIKTAKYFNQGVCSIVNKK
ncbi:uncharacterized protein [Chironomus tepperi]|uniref:uncharacterized protein n=1 Tax=Chironomus tepperi TaxID=113505 RepID=UPI00391FC94B